MVLKTTVFTSDLWFMSINGRPKLTAIIVPEYWVHQTDCVIITVYYGSIFINTIVLESSIIYSDETRLWHYNSIVYVPTSLYFWILYVYDWPFRLQTQVSFLGTVIIEHWIININSRLLLFNYLFLVWMEWTVLDMDGAFINWFEYTHCSSLVWTEWCVLDM